jgi:hypothetical protein
VLLLHLVLHVLLVQGGVLVVPQTVPLKLLGGALRCGEARRWGWGEHGGGSGWGCGQGYPWSRGVLVVGTLVVVVGLGVIVRGAMLLLVLVVPSRLVGLLLMLLGASASKANRFVCR